MITEAPWHRSGLTAGIASRELAREVQRAQESLQRALNGSAKGSRTVAAARAELERLTALKEAADAVATCPTPQRIRHRPDALRRALGRTHRLGASGQRIRPYECLCGAVHLSGSSETERARQAARSN